MTMCDQCVNAIDERHGWEVLHKVVEKVEHGIRLQGQLKVKS